MHRNNGTTAPRARQEILSPPSGVRRRLVEQYHQFKLRRDINGMQAVEIESVLDHHFPHVQRFLDFYRDCQWSGWLSHISSRAKT